MTETQLHPESDRLEAFVAGELDTGEAAFVRSHLAGCYACRSEVDELRDLFAALARMPRFAPTPGFTDRVMARLDPSLVRAGGIAGWLRAVWPPSGRDIGLLAACMAVPVVIGYGLILWWSMRTGLTWQAVVFVGEIRFFDTLTWLVRAAVGAVVWSEISLGIGATAQLWAARLGTSLLAIGAAAGLASSASAWVLYRNLIHTPTRKPYHARIRV